MSVSTASHKSESAGTHDKSIPGGIAAARASVPRVVGTPPGCTLRTTLIKPSFH